MKRPNTNLSRRMFLRGAGAALAIPLLESALPRRAWAQSAGEAPRRFLAYYVPNGIHMDAWTPATAGTDFEIRTILEPLSTFREQITLVSGLANMPARPEGPGDHAGGTSAFLTATHVNKTQGCDDPDSDCYIRNDVSVDQVMAQAAHIGGQTRFRSLVLGLESSVDGAVACDSGYSCAYSHNISWADARTPVAKETSPAEVFRTMFGGADPQTSAAALAATRKNQRSILDFVLEDARAIERKVSARDKFKLDQYMSAVRAVEQQIAAAEAAPQCITDARFDPGYSLGVEAHAQQMNALMTLAFQCDMTRVTTFMYGNAGSNRTYPQLGIRDGHHQISHHQGNPVNHEQLVRIGTFEMEQFADLVARLDAVEDVDGGTLLDNTLVFFSSEIEDGNSHAHHNLPILLAGGAGGAVRSGRHIRYDPAERTPIADLFIRFLHIFGVEAETFGDDGTGPLAPLS